MAYLNKKFAGKKLLLLGTNAGTCDMVIYAQGEGAYVIVTDNLPPEKSAAKLIADEAWPVDTADVDTLEKLAIQNKITGITAGASDFNVERALDLCERMRLPFYCDRKQWETCTNKQRFKQLCRDNGVPVAREYRVDSNHKEEDLKRIKYPVIVKPVDSSSGAGIGKCQNERELIRAQTKAVALSKTHQAIVEELIVGNEFTAEYNIKDGQFSLSNTEDKYLFPEPSKTMSLPQAFIFPSKCTDRYIKELSPKVIQMFKSIGLANGFIFVQGTLNEQGFSIFEANYRLDGASYYRFTSKINGINSMEMLVDYALTGKTEGHNLNLDNPKFNKRCCGLFLVSKGGVVGQINGLEKLKKKKNILSIDRMYDIGDYIEKSGTLRQVLFKFLLIEDTVKELKSSIKQIQDTVKVLDDQGNDMLLPPFDIDRI